MGLRRALAVLAAALLLAAAGSSQEGLERGYVNCPSWVSSEEARGTMSMLKVLLEGPFAYEYEPEARRFRVTATPAQLDQMAEFGFGRGSERSQLAYASLKASWERATSVQIFSLDGRREYQPKALQWFYPRRHGFGQGASCWLEGMPATSAVKAVFQAFEEGFGVALCFNPHHGLAAEVDGHRYELLICYECGNAEAYMDGKPVAVALSTSSSSRALLNRALTDGVSPAATPSGLRGQ